MSNNNDNNGNGYIDFTELREMELKDILTTNTYGDIVLQRDENDMTIFQIFVEMSKENNKDLEGELSEAITIIKNKLHGAKDGLKLMRETCSKQNEMPGYMKCLLECSSCPRKRGGAKTRKQRRIRSRRR